MSANNPEAIHHLAPNRIDNLYDMVPLGAIEAIPRPTPDTWGPPPFNPYADGIFEMQIETKDKIKNRILGSVSKKMPVDTKKYINDTFDVRFRNREMASYEHNSGALEAIERGELVIPDAYLPMYQHGLHATANPAELLLLRPLLRQRSTVLTTSSIGYGSGIESHYAARRAVEQAMLLFGAQFDQWERYSVKDVDVDEAADDFVLGNSIMMTRKRQLGVLLDGTTIRERSSFILRIDQASGFDQTLARAMRHAYTACHDKTWPERVFQAGNLSAVVPPLLNGNKFDAAIPLVTTIYAFNRDTEPFLLNEDVWRERARKISRIAQSGLDT